METEKRKFELEKRDNEIVYSKAIKAGKRIYYLDVKKSRNDDLFLAITESKKRVLGFDENAQISFEKHKIFLYREDFEKFSEGLQDVITFIRSKQGEDPKRPEFVFESNNDNDDFAEQEERKSKSFFGFFGKN